MRTLVHYTLCVLVLLPIYISLICLDIWFWCCLVMSAGLWTFREGTCAAWSCTLANDWSTWQADFGSLDMKEYQVAIDILQTERSMQVCSSFTPLNQSCWEWSICGWCFGLTFSYSTGWRRDPYIYINYSYIYIYIYKYVFTHTHTYIYTHMHTHAYYISPWYGNDLTY